MIFKRCRETSWFKFYKEADRICAKYGISTIKEPERYPDAKHLTMKDKAGMPTRYNLARSALDEAIAMSHNLKQLEYRLSEMGYAFGCNPKRKYWTIKGKGDERPIRLYRLGDEYTKERITRRLIENRDSIDFEPFQPKTCRPKQYRLTNRSDKIAKVGGLYDAARRRRSRCRCGRLQGVPAQVHARSAGGREGRRVCL